MAFRQLLARFFGIAASELPQLYPDLDSLQLAQFMSEQEYARIKSFENVYVLPFISEEGDAAQSCFGVGLARLMIRNLMLLRDVSIHGPEDTPMTPLESVVELASENPRSCYVSGLAEVGEADYALHLQVFRAGRAGATTTVRHADFTKFIRDCSITIGRNLSKTMQLSSADAWEIGQPKGARSLLRCGELSLKFDPSETRAKAKAARAALAADPGFVVPTWEIDNEVSGARETYLQGLCDDPYNAQLCFLTFCAVWNSRGPQPEAMQFCRRAIELSPGLGKAHMCAPHAADPQADMLMHSELGYRLLPGNPFAVNNYTLYLREVGAPPGKLVELAEEGIATDPNDPGNYLQLIELHSELKDYREALVVAERLQSLYEPRMNERALYCLKQNPERARMIETGEYDPANENRRLIADLRRQLTRGRAP